jgi:predicted neuraminidase
VLFVGADGTLTVFYKMAKRIPDWSGWFRQSRDGGSTWSPAQPLPPGFLGPIRCHALARPDGSVLFGSSTESGDKARPWRVHFERCTEPGAWADPARWSRVAPADDTPALNAIQPSLLDHGNGHLVAYARTREGVVARTESSDDGRTWSTLRPTHPRQANPNSGLEALRLPDGRELLVLNPGPNRLQLDAVLGAREGAAWERLHRLDEVTKGEVSYPSALLDTEDGQPVLRVTYTRNRREIVLRTFTLSGL